MCLKCAERQPYAKMVADLCALETTSLPLYIYSFGKITLITRELQEHIPHIKCNHTVYNLLVIITSKVISHSVKVSKIRMGLNINVLLQEKPHHLRLQCGAQFSSNLEANSKLQAAEG